MNRNMEEKLPQAVEDRLQEAYDIIRKGEIKQMHKQSGTYKKCMSVAAALVLIVTVPSAVFAAVTYFQKTAHREADQLTYEFTLNYELVPGEYQVTADYIPEGLTDNGDGKYLGGDDSWITVMPVYTMAELEKINGQIVVEGIDQVQHTQLSGMNADVVTCRNAETYKSPTYIFLFNEKDGYVLHIIAGCKTDPEELMKFADSLQAERIGDGRYETADEKALREQEEKTTEELALEASETWDALIQLGIPQNKIYAVGEELHTCDGAYGYTITGYEFLDGIEGFAENDFFDYTRFDGWLNPDKTLLPYTRQHYGKDGQLLSEDKAEQEILRVNIKVHCYDDQPGSDIPLDFNLNYVDKNPDGTYTWAEDYYTSIPAEDYFLQMNDSAVYIDKAVHTQDEDRKDFFFCELAKDETLSYTLLFVVDQDRKADFLLSPSGSNYSVWQTESMTAKEIRDALEGYIRLQ